MIDPPIWTSEQLDEERAKSSAAFSKERLEEPLEDYLEAFDQYQGYVEEVLETTVDLTDFETSALDVLGDPRLLEAFRYLAAPPISTDDLKVLADASSLTKSRLKNSPADVQRLIGVVRQVLDRRRFAWVVENREPTEAERNAAVLASAALMAASRTQTSRRNKGKEQQEAAVKAALRDLGFTEVPSRLIATLQHAPAPGEFCGESRLGTRKGDIIVGLWDQRIMPIECKVSNSSTNSVKRLNNDAAVKAVRWREDFGRLQVVPSAMLSGVYKLHNLVEAQSRGLTIFWAHDLKALTDWIASTQP
ncbi:Type II restriction-modification system restriction subunit [Granulibacter bethesdensis]|uniref:XamI family restriction endonuclease n=1 Tax=Granulibacter bethesdensis TaxID=364410 RepID=UPI00090C5FD9|nr:XamI family restriction endonuclease [Granulibacter bethesdensis]APH56983.1 Type II restriction-modification system restriction subunit [Granulibacter bethesdensis]